MKINEGADRRSTRIVIADDSPAIRNALRSIIANEKDWMLCATARNGREALEISQHFRPDVAILDISMPEMDGLEATRRISEALPATKAVILTVHNSDQLEAAVVACGADGYVLKSRAAIDLVPAVRQILQHIPYFRCEVGQRWDQGGNRPSLEIDSNCNAWSGNFMAAP